MGRYLLKGPDDDFARWRATAKAQGVSLAVFLRDAANSASTIGPSGPAGATGPAGPTGEVHVIAAAGRPLVDVTDALAAGAKIVSHGQGGSGGSGSVSRAKGKPRTKTCEHRIPPTSHCGKCDA